MQQLDLRLSYLLTRQAKPPSYYVAESQKVDFLRLGIGFCGVEFGVLGEGWFGCGGGLFVALLQRTIRGECGLFLRDVLRRCGTCSVGETGIAVSCRDELCSLYVCGDGLPFCAIATVHHRRRTKFAHTW